VLLSSPLAFAQDVNRLAKLKKADIASRAERLVEGTGSMSAMFKSEGSSRAVLDGVSAEASADVAIEAEEAAEALAA